MTRGSNSGGSRLSPILIATVAFAVLAPMALAAYWVAARPGANDNVTAGAAPADHGGAAPPPAAAGQGSVTAGRDGAGAATRRPGSDLAGAVAALARASAEPRPSERLTIPVPEPLGALQQLIIGGEPEVKSALGRLRADIRDALFYPLRSCLDPTHPGESVFEVAVSLRREGQDFRVREGTLLRVDGGELSPREMACAVRRMAKARRINGEAAPLVLPASFESQEVFRIRVRREVKIGAVVPEAAGGAAAVGG